MKKLLLCSLLLIFPVANAETSVSMLPDWVKVELDRQQNSQKFAKCGTKKKCGQMRSCDEAYYFLKTCGLTRLDRDKDGIPCESICGNKRR